MFTTILVWWTCSFYCPWLARWARWFVRDKTLRNSDHKCTAHTYSLWLSTDRSQCMFMHLERSAVEFPWIHTGQANIPGHFHWIAHYTTVTVHKYSASLYLTWPLSLYDSIVGMWSGEELVHLTYKRLLSWATGFSWKPQTQGHNYWSLIIESRLEELPAEVTYVLDEEY